LWRRAKGGVAEAAQRRLAAISGLPILEINDAAEKLATRFLEERQYLYQVPKTRFIFHWQRCMGWIFF
jgi:hypothetical protein